VIIPFRIENAQPKRGLRVRLSDLHWIDGFVSREMAIDELIKTFHSPSHEAVSKAAGHRSPGEHAARAAHKSAGDEKQHFKAASHRLQSRPALLIGSLAGAATLGTIAVWFALVPHALLTVTSNSSAPIRDPRALRCADESQLKSIDGKQPTVIGFLNDYGTPVRQYWLDYSGQRKFYFTIKQGEIHNQPTYFTHPWLITDAADKCIAIYLPDGRESPVIIR
jgi:von Hippel-Lindau disease tumor supressor